ncbi:MAG: hypothetical protein ACFFAO_20735 [Candidatus Hermodarchaeota archaeon]
MLIKILPNDVCRFCSSRAGYYKKTFVNDILTFIEIESRKRMKLPFEDSMVY